MSRKIGIALTLASALAMGASVMGLRAKTATLYSTVVADEDRYYLPPSTWLRAFSLGYTEALADLLWVRAVTYFGGMYYRADPQTEATSKRPRPRAVHTAHYITAITDLDPRFLKAYLIGSRLVLYHRKAITVETAESAIQVLENGAREFPENGEITFGLGFLYYYELPDVLTDKTARQASKKRGARLLRLAGTMDGVPPYTSLLGVRVLKREGLDELVVEHLRTMLVTETNPKIRQSLEAQLAQELGQAAERDIRTARALRERWRRTRPHVPFDLFLLIAGEETYHPAEVLDPLWLADQRLGLFAGADQIDDSSAEPAPR